MGAGCSSPLRRLGGKKSKQSNRDSISVENNDNLDQMTIAARIQQQQQQNQEQRDKCTPVTTSSAAAVVVTNQPHQQPSKQQGVLNLDNEITIQSEAVEDHPSSASYYTDVRNQADEMMMNKTLTVDLHHTDSKYSTQNNGKFMGPGGAAAKMMGLGGYVQHDRHLLVSPALSPAPSSCQSPAPNCSFVGSGSVHFDLNDLNEAFKTLTFGLPTTITTDNQASSNKQRIKQPERPQSELHNLYSNQLVQAQDDLSKFVTTVFISLDNNYTSLDPTETTIGSQQQSKSGNSNSFEEDLATKISAHLRSICDDNSFNSRFLNLSQDHLGRSLYVNNLADVAMNILEQEYRENSERLVVVMLANGINGNSLGHSISSETPDLGAGSVTTTAGAGSMRQCEKRLLPTKIDAATMNKLMEMNETTKFDQRAKDLLKKWYNQMKGCYFLKPIYLVFTDILNETKESYQSAWQNWLRDSSDLMKALTDVCEMDAEICANLSLKSLSNLFIDFLLKENQLQKRTLLIRNYNLNIMAQHTSSQQSTTVNNSSGGGSVIQSTVSKSSLSELARQLPDPNKLTIKRSMNEQELSENIDDWVLENLSKYIESFAEHRIAHGRYPPPFIERNLFIELTKQRHLLEYNLDSTTDGFETKSQNFYTNQIHPILIKFIDGTLSSSDLNAMATTNTTTTSGISGSNQSLASQPSANHLVIISGPKGCGKTTLFAQLIKYTAQDLFNKAQIIYRFCGSTMDTLNPNRLLRSICEQFCQTQGENTAAASYIYSSRKEIMSSLNKILKSQNCLIFLDGLETFDQYSEISLDWLCELEASERIKIFIMLETDSPLYKKALSSYTDATYITLDNPSLREWAQMLAHTARSKRLSSATNLYEEVKDLGASQPENASSVTYGDVGDILNMCHIRKLNNEQIYPELSTGKQASSSTSLFDYKKIIYRGVLKHLHYILAPSQLCALFIIIDSSRNGLSEQDIVEIMDLLISQLLSAKYSDSSRQVKFTYSLLSYLKIQLKPWIKSVVCDKVVKLTLHKDLTSKALDYYTPNSFPKLVSEVREFLMDYYSKQFRNSLKQQQQQQKGKGSSDSSSKGRASRAEALWMDNQVSEMIHLHILTNPTKAKEFLMNKDNFYSQFLYRSNPEEFIEDYDRLKLVPGRKSSQSNEDLLALVTFIRQSIFPLRYDGSQIYSQIYCRSQETSQKSLSKSRSKKFNEILSQASCPPIRNLLPASETSIDSFIKTRIGLNAPPATATSSSSIISAQSSSNNNIQSQQKPANQLPPSSYTQRSTYGPPSQMLMQQQQQQQQGKQRIFTINDNHRHVIVIYPDKNCVSVWDIFEERAVRTINNVDQPRDLRMINQKQAVILCNRELRVYDLDSGQLLTRLKGVMNQKMPYFEVFGQEYVIALARNRMYVNMLNLSTGELETTFKVGEDRFLNSLLVSANGGVCVCGDETQKPFPLLVWNLNERRLMYDLRLDRHEFITRMSAISDDGHFVVSVCKQLGSNTNEGLSSASSSSTPPTTSSGGSSVVQKSPSTPNFIVIYDLNSGTLFKKWKPGLDTCAVAISLSANRSGKVMNALVDSTILVWDLSTGSKRHTLIGHSAPADVISVQSNRLFSMDSTCRDQSLRIWDIDEGYCLAVFSPDAPISCCQMSARGDALICGFESETRLSTLLMCKNESVNEVIKKNRRRKSSSKASYIFDESPTQRKGSTQG